MLAVASAAMRAAGARQLPRSLPSARKTACNSYNGTANKRAIRRRSTGSSAIDRLRAAQLLHGTDLAHHPATRQRTAYVTHDTFLPHRHRNLAAAGRQRATRIPRRAHGFQRDAPHAGISPHGLEGVAARRARNADRRGRVRRAGAPHDPARGGERAFGSLRVHGVVRAALRDRTRAARSAVPLACVHREPRRDALVPHAGGGGRGRFRRSGRAHADPVPDAAEARDGAQLLGRNGSRPRARHARRDAGVDGRGAQAASDAGANRVGIAGAGQPHGRARHQSPIRLPLPSARWA